MNGQYQEFRIISIINNKAEEINWYYSYVLGRIRWKLGLPAQNMQQHDYTLTRLRIVGSSLIPAEKIKRGLNENYRSS